MSDPEDRIIFYTDDDVHGQAVIRARKRGVEIVTSNEAGNRGADDIVHFAYAIEHGYVLVTGNMGDFEALFYEYAATGRDQPGMVCISSRIRQKPNLIAGTLHLIYEVADREYMKNRIWRA